jgi:radical SAM protein with 4Fe4S-binding SPASM domain
MEAPHIPEIPRALFYDHLTKTAGGERFPFSGSIELTACCNLNCVHCYMTVPESAEAQSEAMLDRDEWADLLDQLASAGCVWLLLTGGEPLLHRDFPEIYAAAIRKGFLITLFTNATLLNRSVADCIAEQPPVSIEVTCYGSTAATYERITGVRGSHARFLQGLDLLLERDLAVKLKTMVMTLNRHELPDMKSFAEQRGLDFRFDPIVNLRLDGDIAPAEFRIPPSEVVSLDMSDSRRMAGWMKFCGERLGAIPDNDYLFECGAGLRDFHIDAYGRLSACMMARRPIYDLRRGSFREGWTEFLPAVRAQRRTRHERCRACELRDLCENCPGVAMIEVGDPELPVPYLCEVAHLRARRFGLDRIREAV